MINLQEEKDLLNTVEISARRFEESPFIERHDTSKMIRGVYANRFQAVYICLLYTSPSPRDFG